MNKIIIIFILLMHWSVFAEKWTWEKSENKDFIAYIDKRYSVTCDAAIPYDENKIMLDEEDLKGAEILAFREERFDGRITFYPQESLPFYKERIYYVKIKTTGGEVKEGYIDNFSYVSTKKVE